MAHLRGWLAAAAIGIGVGAALALGCGTAAADAGPAKATASTSHHATKAAATKPAASSKAVATHKVSRTMPVLPTAATRPSARTAAKATAAKTARATVAQPPATGVTGVTVGHSDLDIPVGTGVYTGAADWYFPTQADGSVQAQGVIYLQHGFLGKKSWYSALATQQAQQTNSVVVVPNVPSFPSFTCRDCTLNSVQMQQGVAALFVDPNRSALNLSATAAGYEGVLPENFVLTGHSAGGGLAVAAGGFYSDAVAPDHNSLLGVVMYDGVSNGTLAPALQSLGDIPVYQIAAPPQPWNANGQTTNDLVALRPDQFVGDTLANGSHVDSLIGGVPLIDFVSQLLIKRSPAGNTAAVYTLSNGWINDFYAGRGPSDPLYGIYGDPDQYLVMGPTAAVVLGPAPVEGATNKPNVAVAARQLIPIKGASPLDGSATRSQSVSQHV